MRTFAPRRLGASILLLAATFYTGCAREHPPALSGITIVAVDERGEPAPAYAARTLLRPPVPVIGVRPGRPPRVGTLFWNEPTSGAIHITLVQGRQSFTFHTTTWSESRHFVVALFFDKQEQPALVLESDGQPTQPGRLLKPLGIDGALLASQPSRSAVQWNGYEIRVEELILPETRFALDVIGPWKLRPDNVADLVGTVVLSVRKLPRGG